MASLWSLLTGLTLAVHPTSASISEGHVEARYDSTLHVGLAGTYTFDPFVFGAAIGSDYASLRMWGQFDKKPPARHQWAVVMECENTRYYAGPQYIYSRVHFICGGGEWFDRLTFEYTVGRRRYFRDMNSQSSVRTQTLSNHTVYASRRCGPGFWTIGLSRHGVRAAVTVVN